MSTVRCLRRFLPQLAVLGLLLGLQGLAAIHVLPPISELNLTLGEVLETSGLGIVALFSFLENLPGFNVYFPGSIVILTRMAMTAGSPGLAIATYFAILLPAVAANILSYALGWWLADSSYLQRLFKPQEARVPERRGIWFWYASTYWHPQLAALTALASGAHRTRPTLHFPRFLIVSLAWSLFWAILLYNFGTLFTVKSHLIALTYIYLALWILWDLRSLIRERKPSP